MKGKCSMKDQIRVLQVIAETEILGKKIKMYDSIKILGFWQVT